MKKIWVLVKFFVKHVYVYDICSKTIQIWLKQVLESKEIEKEKFWVFTLNVGWMDEWWCFGTKVDVDNLRFWKGVKTLRFCLWFDEKGWRFEGYK